MHRDLSTPNLVSSFAMGARVSPEVRHTGAVDGGRWSLVAVLNEDRNFWGDGFMLSALQGFGKSGPGATSSQSTVIPPKRPLQGDDAVSRLKSTEPYRTH